MKLLLLAGDMIYETFSNANYYRFKSGAVHTRLANASYPPSTTMYQNKLGRAYPPIGGPATIRPSSVQMVSHTILKGWTNQLYDKLREELTGEHSEILTSSVEWKSSLDMISGRARQLGSAFLAVKRFRFKQAALILGIQTPARFKNLTKKGAQKKKLSPTSAWLEYWMGWAPACGDIANAIDILQKGPPASVRHFNVGVGIRDVRVDNVIGSSGNKTNISTTYTRTGSYAAYGDVEVTNHNVDLANKMGFVNPILTMWQVVPFSFIVDWFANVGTILGSLTDFVGLTFKNTGTALYYTTVADARGVYGVGTSAPTKFLQVGFAWIKMRFPGALPKPRLDIRMLDKLSLTRAATSISLLVESFLRK